MALEMHEMVASTLEGALAVQREASEHQATAANQAAPEASCSQSVNCVGTTTQGAQPAAQPQGRGLVRALTRKLTEQAPEDRSQQANDNWKKALLGSHFAHYATSPVEEDHAVRSQSRQSCFGDQFVEQFAKASNV